VPTANGVTSAPVTIPGPSKGIVLSTNQAIDSVGTAWIMRNMIPTERGGRLRGGTDPHGLLLGTDQVQEMFTYKSGPTEKMFAATNSAIFDVTSPPVPPSTTSSVVSGLTSGDWVSMMQSTPAGQFLIIANGADTVRNYDGTTWTAPSITGPAATSDLIYCWTFARRGFYIEKDSLDVWYLGVNAISGAANVFPLGSVFNEGGKLIAGFDWSIESGDGPSNLCCFLTSKGEVAVYAGTDPATASDWVLKGVFDIGEPLGKHAIMKAGGDVMIATTTGLIPLSKVFVTDVAALSAVAVSKNVEDYWKKQATESTRNWKIGVWREQSLAFISKPDSLPDNDILVVNLLTGGWGIVKNWTAAAWEILDGELYFGSSAGQITKADTTAEDEGTPFEGVYLSTFASMGNHGEKKSAKLMTMTFLGTYRPDVRLFVKTDFDAMNIPAAVAGTLPALVSERYFRIRQTVRGSGQTIAAGVVITSEGDTKIDTEVIMSTIQVEAGEGLA
jgi:hypothetical protein